VGETKAEKGSRLMAIVEDPGILIGLRIESAGSHEFQSVESTLDTVPDWMPPIGVLVGEKASDSDSLEETLKRKTGINLIAPHRTFPKTASYRKLFRMIPVGQTRGCSIGKESHQLPWICPAPSRILDPLNY
jgi:hypothetical protein